MLSRHYCKSQGQCLKFEVKTWAPEFTGQKNPWHKLVKKKPMSFNVIHTCGFSPCAEGQGTRHTQSVKLPMSRAKWAKSKRSFWLAPEILRGSSRFGAALANTYGFVTDSPLMNMQVYFCPVCHFSWMAWLKQIKSCAWMHVKSFDKWQLPAFDEQNSRVFSKA